MTSRETTRIEGPPADGTRAATSGASRSTARVWASVATYAFLLAGAVLTVGPYLLAVVTSLKPAGQMMTEPVLSWPNPVTGANYAQLFGSQVFFQAPIAVTAQMVAVLVVFQLGFSILAAYAFAYLRFPGREAVFWVYLATLMIPQIVTVIPLYLMMSQAGLRNTFWGLVVPLMFGSPYAIFLLRENFRSMSSELLDAAKLDGAGNWRTLWSIVLPMNKPILATLLLITVVSQWNSFLWPKIVTSSKEWQVLTVATNALQSQYNNNWTLVMAAAMVAMAPLVVLFVVFQKQIIRSIGITGFR